MKNLNIMVKYCGGCNPQYNRTKIIKELEERLSTKIIHYDATVNIDLIFLVKGCRSECLNIDKYKSKYGIFIIEEEKDFEEVLDKIKTNIIDPNLG